MERNSRPPLALGDDRHHRALCRAARDPRIPDGFAIAIKRPGLTIGRGRIYVDGLQAENHGAGDLEFDPILAESRGVDPIPYDQQPYFPNAPDAPTTGGPHLVYIDVWEREVTSVENPEARRERRRCGYHVASANRLAGARFAQRRRRRDLFDAENVPGWLDIIQPSAGRLTTEAIGVPTTSDPCLIPPSGGYRGLENRTYRVEIHDGGVVGTATFKWSRDNASFASRMSGIENDTHPHSRSRHVGFDTALSARATGSKSRTTGVEFSGQAGDMRQIDSVDEPSHTITLKSALTGGRFWVDGQNLTDPGRHTRIKRWDQADIVKDSAGNNYVNLDAAWWNWSNHGS